MKGFKKRSLTVAKVFGFFAGVLTLVTLVAWILGTEPKDFFENILGWKRRARAEQLRKRTSQAKAMIAEKLLFKADSMHIDSVFMTDLVGNKDTVDELLNFTKDSVCGVAVCSFRHDEPSLIYLDARVVLNGFGPRIEPVHVDFHNYFMVSETAGNHAAFNCEIFKYEGFGLPSRVYDDWLPSGDVAQRGDRLFASSSAGVFEILSDKGKLRKVKIPISTEIGLGSIQHSLTIRERRSVFSVLYDKEVIGTKDVENYAPIVLTIGDEFVLIPDLQHDDKYEVRDFMPAIGKLELLFENDRRVFRAISPGDETVEIMTGSPNIIALHFKIRGDSSIDPIGPIGKAKKESDSILALLKQRKKDSNALKRF